VRRRIRDRRFAVDLREEPDIAFLPLKQRKMLGGALAFHIPSSDAHVDDLLRESTTCAGMREGGYEGSA
jgi:hypothetical protein